MKIDMNKDFEMEFQSTVIKEFTGREVGTGIVAFLSAGGVSVLALNLTEPVSYTHLTLPTTERV